MNNFKFLKGKVIFLILSVLLTLGCISGVAHAANYAANAGLKTATAFNSDASTPLSIGHALQYIWLKPGGGTKIYGPTDTNGNVNSTYEQDQPKVFPALSGCNLVGYDTSSGAQTDLAAGKFYHQVLVDTSAQSVCIIRAWNAATIVAATNFGETIAFATNDDPMKIPSENDLPTFSTIFPKLAPAAPTPVSATCPQVSGSNSPVITINCTNKIGSRYYKFQLYSDAGYTNQVGTTSTVYYNDLYHYAAPADSGTKSTTFSVSPSTEDRTFYYQVLAGNSFGESDYASARDPIWVPKNSDPTIPAAITDLQATVEGRTVHLSWTAPYDTNSIGVEEHCAAYDIRVSNEALTDLPANPFTGFYGNTNFSNLNSWVLAESIYNSFPSSSINPNPMSIPSSWQTKDQVTISNITTDGTFFFAVKAQDNSGNWSYISNVAGVMVGVGVASLETKTYTLTRLSGGLGINTIAIPFSILVQPAISNLLQLIQEINIQAGANNVYSLGWWDASTMNPVGYEIKYKTAAINDIDSIIGTTGLNYPNTQLIVKDKPYQVYVIDNSTFTIRGTR